MKRYSWIAALLVVALAFVLFGCGGEAPYVEKPLYDYNVLQITTLDSWTGLDIVGAKKGDGTAIKGGIKFKEDDEIYIKGVTLVDPEQLMFSAPRYGWKQIKQINYQPAAGEPFEETIALTSANITSLTTDEDGAAPSWAATTPFNLRLRGNKIGGSFIIEELTYSIGGSVEVFALSALIEDLEPGVIEEEDFNKISSFLQAAGGEGEVIYEIIGPAK